MSALPLIIVLAAIGMLASRVVAWPLLSGWSAVTTRSLHGARWTPWVTALPAMVGLVIVAGVLSPSTVHLSIHGSCHCDALSTWFHLCARHPEKAAGLVPLAVPVLLACGWRPVRAGLGLLRGWWQARRLRAARDPAARADDPHPVHLDIPGAATVGLLRPVVTVDATWWSGLDRETRHIVQQHESAHVRRRDPLVSAWVRLLGALGTRRTAERLHRDWLDWAEHCADRHAAAECGDRFRVAEVLVAQHRRMRAARPAWHGGRLERRVAALLDARPRRRRPASDVRGFFWIAPGITVLGVWSAGTFIHRLVEHLLNHIVL